MAPISESVSTSMYPDIPGTMAPVSESGPISMYHAVSGTTAVDAKDHVSIKKALIMALVLLATFSPLAIIFGFGFLAQPSELFRSLWHQANNQSLHTVEEQTYWAERKKYAPDYTWSGDLSIISPSASLNEDGTSSGPSKPRPHDLPPNSFYNAVDFAFGSIVKVAGWSAACFSAAVIYYRPSLSARSQ
ncbi:hypothetical protein L207DRAFT_511162 [Hyaloscypha variabilis F]|uniref:Uncharacterized protein n=1 Tax=Hyaloscypha variabilis (strain UAMH 11265 / GT02V1 / F) TaxID=1149755 RepID=A0A2J6RRW8_HYAVF|nr:hypothetical protein L207DRAFT_511162 [Hyaloscypha variabilis F]